MNDRKANGESIRRRRKAIPSNPSQEQVAALVGVPAGTYVNWELGRSMPPKLSRDKLDEVFRALESGGDLRLGLDVTPETLAKLKQRAEEEGKTVEEVASGIFKAIYGLLIFGLFAANILLDEAPAARLRGRAEHGAEVAEIC